MKAVRIRQRLSTRLTLTFSLLILFVSASMSLSIFLELRESQRAGMRDRLHDILSLAQPQVDGDFHALIRDTEDQSKSFYRFVLQSMRDIQRSSSGIQRIYTIRKQGNGPYQYVVDASPQAVEPFGSVYATLGSLILEQGTDRLRKPQVEVKIERDQDGDFLRGYAPIFTRFNQTDAILVIEMDAAPLWANEVQAGWRALVVFLATAPVAVLIGWALAHRLTSPVSDLVKAAQRVTAGNLDLPVPVRGSDEIGVLAQAFNAMIAQLSHTLEALRKSEEGLRGLNEELEKRVRDRTAQLEATNKELEAFSYSVSHDLRAPLRSIDGFGQALLEDCGESLDDTGREHLHRIRAASQRMGDLIEDMLRLSRITRSEICPKRVDLSGQALEITDRLKAGDPGRTVTVAITPGLKVQADENLICIVLENLLGNAWKFTRKTDQARIELGVLPVGVGPLEGEQQDLPVYYVRDNGAGFDMAYRSKLFGAFQRLHPAAEFEGTGVGLATVQRIVHRHGGRVWAEGGVNRGATFFFTLPEERA